MKKVSKLSLLTFFKNLVYLVYQVLDLDRSIAFSQLREGNRIDLP